MLSWAVVLIMQIATAAQPPPILLIAREPLKAGSEAVYRAIEEETARLAVTLGCPHPYLAAESLTGPKEVWWFNGFQSAVDRNRVADGYAKNTRWMEALQQNSQRKASVTMKVIEVDRKSTRLNSSHIQKSRMPSSA